MEEPEPEPEPEEAEPEPVEPRTDDEYIAALLEESLVEEEPEPGPEPEIKTEAVEPAPEKQKQPLPVELPLLEDILTEELQSRVVTESFVSAEPAMGSWQVAGEKARQDDNQQLFAKLVLPAIQRDRITKYSFSAKSTGRGWTGLGLHIYRDRSATHRGYGAGNSILVWVTYDPKNTGDTSTRLQMYRSYSDTYMELIKSTVIPESIFESNAYEIIFNNVNDGITVMVNGANRMEADGLDGLTEGAFVVFRTLDTADFEDFTMEVMEWKGRE